MARRSSSTPLYELMSRRAPAGADPDGSVTGPGRAVRVPVGWLLLGAAGVILLLVVVYVVASWRSAERTRADLDDEFLAGGAGDPAWRAEDPLAGRAGEPRSAAGDERADAPGSADPPPPAPVTEPTSPAGWGPLESDPRVAGRHYVVLIETRPEGARRLAAFCRERGLEAYVVSAHNLRNRRVIVLPGFPSRSTSNPDVRRLLDRVHRVGKAWKAEHPGDGDLSDAYLYP